MKLKNVVVIVVMALAAPLALWAGHADNGCDGCHTPHGGSSSIAPLWGGPTSGEVGNFIMYPSGGTLQAVMGSDPDGDSLLCLGCHDDASYPAGWQPTDPNDRLGTDLSATHPLSFVYNTALQVSDNAAGGHLNDPATTDSGLGQQIDDDMLDGAGKVQCTSCHAAHSTVGKMLRKSNASGALCKTCHGNT